MLSEILGVLPQSLSKDTLHLLIKEAALTRREELKLKQLEVQREISANKIAQQDRAVKVSSHMKEVISSFVQSEGADNNYAPMAISSISRGFASLLHEGGDLEIDEPELDLSLYENPKKVKEKKVKELKSSSTPIEKRIKDAMEQGFRWNDHNVMPSNESTVLRKIGQWESGVESGRECDLADVFSREYDKLLKDQGKAFLVGACMAAEADLSITDQLSPYLKRRFNTLKEIYQGREPASQVVNVEPVTQDSPTADPLVLLEGLYRHIFQENATDEHWDAKKGHLLRLYQNRDNDIHRMDGATLGRLVDLGVCPATITWRSEEEKRRFLNLQPGMWLKEQREYYAGQMEALRDEFIALMR